MRMCVAALALFMVPVPVQDADTELARALELLKSDPARGVERLETIARTQPSSASALQAYAALARHWLAKKDNAAATDVLRRLARDFGPRVLENHRDLVERAILKEFSRPICGFSPNFQATVLPKRATLVQYRLLGVPNEYVLQQARTNGPWWESPPRDRLSVLMTWTVRFDATNPRPQQIACDRKSPGFYLLEEEIDGFAMWTPVEHREIAFLVKGGREDVFIYAYRAATGEPLAGVALEFYEDGGLKKGATDASGRATFARTGGGAWIVGQAEQQILSAYVREFDAESVDICAVRTDRPLYRGGQTVHFRIYARDRGTKGLEYKKAKTLPIEILDPEDRRIYRRDHALGPLGTIDGSFTLADEPALGTYRIVVRDEHMSREDAWWVMEDHTGRFDVREFRKPEIKVTVESAGARKATIEAKYLFGSPAAGARVTWRAKAVWHYEERDGGPEIPDAFAWYQERQSDPWSYTYEEDLGSGEGVTDAAGRLAITWPEAEDEGSVTVIETEVVDESRRPSIGRCEIPTAGADLRLRMHFGRNFYRAGQTAAITVVAMSLDGKPVRDRKIDLAAYEPAPDREYEQFFHGTATTDARGVARFEVKIERACEVRFRARSGKAVTRRSIAAAGEDFAVPVDWDAERSLEAMPEQFVYRSGETVSLFVRAPRKGMTALLTIESDRVLRSEIVRLRSRAQVLEIPLPEVSDPTVTLKLHTCEGNVPYASGVRLLVVPRDRWLDVRVATDRATYRPREKAKVSIEVKDGFGKPVEGEVSLGAVDEAIYLLQEDRSPDIRRVFYPPSGVYVPMSGSGPYTDDVFDPFDFSSGVLTGATFSLDEKSPGAVDGVAHTETRRWFPDTLHWSVVKTDAAGRAEIDLEIADSLTTWVFTATAVGRNHQFGWGRSTTLARKNVIARLVAPRFLTQGDEAVIAVLVHNDLDTKEAFAISLEAKGAEIVGRREVQESVDARGVKRIEWRVKATSPGTATLSTRAMGRRESDAMELDLPVRVRGIPKAEAKTGRVERVAVEKLSLPAGALEPELVIVVSPGPAGAVLDALPYLAGFPYGCVEQTMSRFLPTLVTHRALRKLGIRLPQLEADLPKMLNAGLQRLYDFQHGDGGWGWWKHDATSPWMTAYVVMGLSEAKGAGVDVDERVLSAGVECLKKWAGDPYVVWAIAHEADLPATLPQPADAPGRLHLALALLRKGRAAEARKLVEGAAAPDVETASLQLRAALLLGGKSEDLVSRILAGRRGAEWRSTRESAFAIYALTDYLASTGDLGLEASITVQVNGREVYRGKVTKETLAEFRGVVRVKDLQAVNEVRIESSRPGLFYSARLGWHEAGERLRPQRSGLQVSRKYERVLATPQGDPILEPLESGSEVKPGDLIRVTVTLRAEGGASHLLIEDPIPAGCEAVEDADEWNPSWWFCRREYRNDRTCIAVNEIGGKPELFTYHLRVMLPGRYHALPARASDMYDPATWGTSGEFELRVAQ